MSARLPRAAVTLAVLCVLASAGQAFAGQDPDTPPPGPVSEGTGLTPAQGAGIGALIGGAVFAYWASVSDGGDGGPEDVMIIPFGALIGAFIGGGLARE
jgi:hypothetical protein